MWYNIFAKQLEWNKECFCTVMQPGLNLYELCVVGSPMNLVPIVLLCSATYVPTFGDCQPKHTTSETRMPQKLTI